MTATTLPQVWMSLADVARLAQVERPVASMWRRRHIDFPPPVGEQSGHPVFDAERVGRWLRDTQHGNNPEAYADAIAYAHGHHVDTDELAALLTLAAITGELPGDHDLIELSELAGQIDPSDRCLRREIESLASRGSATSDLPEYADRLIDAAYGADRALAMLFDRRLRHDAASGRPTTLGTALSALVTSLVGAVTQGLDLQPPTLLDASRGGTGLIEAATAGIDDTATILLADHDGRWMRGTHRRARGRGLFTRACPLDDGLPVFDEPELVVLQLPDGPRPGMTDREMLSEIGELTLRMGPQQWAIVLAPASALTDRLRDTEAERDRDDILRSGRLRLALRLPGGQLPHRGHQCFGLWLLGEADPDVAPSQRWTVVGDLRDVPLTQAVREEVVTDAVTSLGDVHVMRGHAFRHARLANTAGLVAARGDLVTAVPRREVAVHTPGQDVVAIRELAQDAGLSGLAVRPPDDAHPSSAVTTTLGGAIEKRLVRLVPGHRIRDHDIHDAAPDAVSGVVVLGESELTNQTAWGSRRIERLILQSSYPAAELTRPGDVVFCTSGRVTARVDRQGGSVVCSPARVLRVAPGSGDGLVPDVLVADLIRQPVAAKAYRTWTVRLVPGSQRSTLTAATDRVAEATAELQERLAALEALQTAMTDAVAAGAALLEPDPRPVATGDNVTTTEGE